MGWIVAHALPFHDSASGAPLLWPTAMQPAAAHDTPDRELLVAPAGVVWIDQKLPSHRSASVTPPEYPTAVHAVGLVQDTPDRELLVAPAGFGVVWIVHLVRSHPSARVRFAPELVA
jgi:hypothetical protein